MADQKKKEKLKENKEVVQEKDKNAEKECKEEIEKISKFLIILSVSVFGLIILSVSNFIMITLMK